MHLQADAAGITFPKGCCLSVRAALLEIQLQAALSLQMIVII